ncbi:hypothetical protein ASJ81_13330 [Methanosarcina spelaei]|uniref:Uncharacterized protein n=1 Tax=Methanosarcina spelaei TaxID=1036679 RepID=A0A2A2HMV7_9EURY|nr:hypothetical protein [Methanosarcina spelaei]PAV10563.1 hypothetical protein ASJ81_13330 [Methanosarcina spelaei]
MSILNETGATDLGLTSVKDNDELGVLRSIDFLTERGTEYINRKLEPDAKKTVISIRDIGSAAVFQKMEIGVFLSLFSLGKMAEIAREQKMTDTGLSILYSLCAIGKAAVGQNMESAVRIAVAYLGEIANSASLQKTEREAIAATLAIGSIGKETFGQQNIQIPENGGFLPPKSYILLSRPPGKEAILFSGEFPGSFSLLVQQGGEINSLEDIPILSENESSYSGFTDFENLIIRTTNSLGTMIFEVKEKFLISHMLMTKLALDTLNGSEYIHEAESLD